MHVYMGVRVYIPVLNNNIGYNSGMGVRSDTVCNAEGRIVKTTAENEEP